MTNRLSVITTRAGDDGNTSLGDGQRVSKTHLRVQALGDVDELNSHIGVLRCEALPSDIDSCLTRIQRDLFDMGAELAVPGYEVLTKEHVLFLEQQLQHYNADLPPLKEFILPGGCRAAALAHIVRTVARRAERAVIALNQTDQGLSDSSTHYLNRLSDLAFVLARQLNKANQTADVLWR
ncbi:MAG TPA: cob(I)yrinic acid a,c-diamide adenosyltransferase [Alcaligenaceae bacterium]|nr:cob(I)yrinic acid a,c-diamide adenosyltransferase [Alcaligenaceae bacterium]